MVSKEQEEVGQLHHHEDPRRPRSIDREIPRKQGVTETSLRNPLYRDAIYFFEYYGKKRKKKKKRKKPRRKR